MPAATALAAPRLSVRLWRRLVLGLFCAPGVNDLLYEVAWTRMLRWLFGDTVLATSNELVGNEGEQQRQVKGTGDKWNLVIWELYYNQATVFGRGSSAESNILAFPILGFSEHAWTFPADTP